MIAAKNSRLTAPFCLLLAVLTLAAGCTEQTALTPTTPTRATTNPAAADLQLALDSLRKLAEGNDNQPGQRTIYYLNQWISSDPAAAAAWQPDRMLDSLPRALRNTPGLERLSKLQFSLDEVDYLRQFQWLDDISYLQQNLWLHDIAQRVRREPAPALLRPWLKEIETSVGLPEAEQLTTAERLLDWVARNIQLDDLPPMPKDPLATAGSTETVLPSLRGEVGPGYGHLPLEILLYGHGDAHERARIFILLCRQVGIDGAMLGFQEEQSTARRGWLPAVLVGGKLYLFDTGLGLPIPGPEGKGIATLDQVLKDAKLLRQLDVPGEAAYPVIEKDLKQGVLAMIDAEPAALSRRMQLLQAAMPPATRLALATQPSQLEPKLRKTNVSGVSLWPVAFDAVLYRIGHQQLAARDQQVAKELHRLGILFMPARPLIKARNLHLQGRYENEDRKPGARSLYLQCRQPDRQIEALLTNESYRKSIGLEQALPSDPGQRQAQLDFITSIAREEKSYATFGLGMTYYESGKYEAATEWLTRTVEVSPASPWTPAARYNLARCYEHLGRIDLARQWLESDHDSPQRHGNLLRAKMLAQQSTVK
ncbi:MAG TPA: tetratricopeptide repeat protein [Pirellulaceae bacterium]|nr:tetratricopeptide repeat protein [Pirellulaceae bacterium]